MPFFSVVIPLYNKGKYIARTIESVLNQTYGDFELLIINDGSTDDGPSVVSSYKDERIHLINKENGGVSSARNTGILNSKGSWISFLDGDDILYPNALEHYKNLIMRFPEAKIVATGCDQTNKKYPASDRVKWITDYDREEAIMVAKCGMSVLNSDCICVNKKCFESIGVFNENYTHGEDTDMWYRLSVKYSILKSETVTALYITNYTDNSGYALNKKQAPRGSLNTPRNELKNKSQKLYLGSIAFYHILHHRKDLRMIIPVTLRYWDCIVMFTGLVVKYRVFKSQ